MGMYDGREVRDEFCEEGLGCKMEVRGSRQL